MSMMWQLRHVRASYLVVPVRATLLGGPGTQNMLCFQIFQGGGEARQRGWGLLDSSEHDASAAQEETI